jgi:hypothetical protein
MVNLQLIAAIKVLHTPDRADPKADFPEKTDKNKNRKRAR